MIEELILNIAYALISTLIPILIAFLVRFLSMKLGTERLKRIDNELKVNSQLAEIAVRYVEQVYRDKLHGSEKFQKAAEWLSTQAKKRGINLDEDEIKGLIEAALRKLKDEFGEQWAKVISEQSPAK